MDDRASFCWARCQRAIGISSDAAVHARRPGSSPTTRNLLLDLIRRSDKTRTFSLLAEYEVSSATPPVAGEYLFRTDYDGEPGCVVRLLEVQTLPSRCITSDWIQVEGPQLRGLERWRQVHRNHWAGVLERSDPEPSRDMPVPCRRFVEKVYPA